MHMTIISILFQITGGFTTHALVLSYNVAVLLTYLFTLFMCWVYLITLKKNYGTLSACLFFSYVSLSLKGNPSATCKLFIVKVCQCDKSFNDLISLFDIVVLALYFKPLNYHLI